MRRVFPWPWGAIAVMAIAALGPRPAAADAIILAGPEVLDCAPAGTCAEVFVSILGVPRPLGFRGVRGIHVNLKIEGNISLCSDTLASNFTQGDFLSLGGATTTGLVVVADPITGIITVDQAITGDPPCRDADAGTLFVITVKSIAAIGSGAITVTDVAVRDCDNAPIAAAPGPPATIAFNGDAGVPLTLQLKAVPSVIWPPDGALHDIHIEATTTGGCGPVTIGLEKIEARCEEADDDDGDHNIVLGALGHEPPPGDVVGAEFGQPDFDFKLRARECDEDGDDMRGGGDGDCEHTCQDDCRKRCEDEVDYHCDQIADSGRRDECEHEERDAREKCEDHCEHDCDDDCEREEELVYRITYSATDDAGHIASARTTVRVQRNTVMNASASLGSGPGLDDADPAQQACLLVTIPSVPRIRTTVVAPAGDVIGRSIPVDAPPTDPSGPSLPGGVVQANPSFNAETIDPHQIFIGDANGLVAAGGFVLSDVNWDGLVDFIARFDDHHFQAVRELSSRPGAHLNLFFRDLMGHGYTVPNVLGDGWIWPGSPGPGPVPRGIDPASRALDPTLAVTRMEPAFPNPARGRVSFALVMATTGEARIEVFDLRGAKVRTIMDGPQPAGRQVLTWDGHDDAGRSLPDGLYLVRVRAGKYRATRSAVFIR